MNLTVLVVRQQYEEEWRTRVVMKESRDVQRFSMNGSWRGRRVTIFGLAREGSALAKFLAERGAEVIVTDSQDESALAGRVQALAGLPVQYALGGHPDWVLEADIIFVSPGIPRTIPPLVKAMERGVILSSETELFFSLCLAPIIGITGSSGKTTTTTLVGRILEAAGEMTWIGGNIGEPLLDVVTRIKPTDKVVLELSSFQLEHLEMSPHIAAILNITPNHLDRHGTMEVYIEAKRQIIQHQGAGDVAVFGRDNAIARRLAESYMQRHPGNRAALFSSETVVNRGAYLDQGNVMIARDGNREIVCPKKAIRLRGRHNVMNVLAACAIASESGASVEAMRQTVTTFAGVEHRLELVCTVRGVQYVNDSIATTPERAIAALESYDVPIVLLAGGRDKHLPWEAWADLALQKTRHVILFGESADLIARALAAAFERAESETMELQLAPERVHLAGTLANAVSMAAKLARAGEVVLLSPGGTSYDAYVDFVERGQEFRELVRTLTE